MSPKTDSTSTFGQNFKTKQYEKNNNSQKVKKDDENLFSVSKSYCPVEQTYKDDKDSTHD